MNFKAEKNVNTIVKDIYIIIRNRLFPIFVFYNNKLICKIHYIVLLY